MTTLKMSEQQQEIITDAIRKFFSACLQRVVGRSSFANRTVISFMASILYLIKNGYISKSANVSDDEGLIISKIDLAYLSTLNTQLQKEWQQKGIHNEALIANIPDFDPMAESVLKDIELIKTWVLEPAYLFEFVEIISKNRNSEHYFLNILDLAISLLFPNPIAGQYSQPVEFGQLAAALIDLKGKTIFNPFSGLMSFATSFDGYNTITGIDNNPTIWEIGKYRMHFANLDNQATSNLADACDWTDNKYDIIVSTPPLGMSLSLKGERSPIDAACVCLKKFVETTTEGGVLFTYVVPSLLIDVKNKVLRETLTKNNYLDAVVFLPKDLMRPYTSISMVALLLKKGRSQDAPIKMIDASSLIKGDKKRPALDVDAVVNCFDQMPHDISAHVSREDILGNDYMWDPLSYIYNQADSFPEGYKVIELEKIVEPVIGEKNHGEKSGHLAKIAELSSDYSDCVRPVEHFELSSDLANARKITEPVILLSTIRLLKPTFCEASVDNPIFIHPHVMACKIKKDWISPTYLCLELSRRYVETAGVVMPHITRSTILKLKIALPSFEETRSLEQQKNLYQEAVYNQKLSRAKELGLQSVIDNMKAEYINTVRMRRHDMLPYMRELGSVSRLMHKYTEMSDSEELRNKMNDVLNKFDNAFNSLSALIDVFSQEDKFGKPELLNVDEYLDSYAGSYNDRHSINTIEYNCDNRALLAFGFSLKNSIVTKSSETSNRFPWLAFIEIAPLDFDRLVNNIVENAQTHGFTDPQRKDYHIEIHLSVDPERGMFQIDFANNGNPLPDGMDKQRYGILGEKAGKTGGTGQGGYIVKSIVEHYHGDYDVFMEDMNTVVRILLPIAKTED